MPCYDFCSVDERALTAFVKKVRGLLEQQKHQEWVALLDQLAAIPVRSRLWPDGSIRRRWAPIDDVILDYPELRADCMPDFDSPGVRRLLLEATLLTADLTLPCSWDGFGAFLKCDLLTASPEEEAERDLLRSHLLSLAALQDSAFPFLHDADRESGYAPHSSIALLCEAERQHGLLQRLGDEHASSDDNIERYLGLDALRMRSFLFLLEASSLGAYFAEPIT